MQFKNPEYLYFLFFLAIPILVHLFQLRKFKKEWFTNVRFLKELVSQTRKSSKIKKWLLLFTRLLLLSFLILAFAQPFQKNNQELSSDNEIHLLLDNSFSMQAKGKKGELLKRSIQDIMEHFPEDQLFSLYTNDEKFVNIDIKSIQKELINLEYSPLPFQPEIWLEEIKNNQRRKGNTVLVITDGIGLKNEQLSVIDKENTYFIIPKAEIKTNVAVDSVYLKQSSDNFHEVAVQLKSFGSYKNDIPVALYNGKQLIAKTQVLMDEETKTLTFSLPKTPFHGFVSIEDNGLTFDNFYYFTLTSNKKTNVLVIGEFEKSKYLAKIYQESEFDYLQSPLSNLDYNQIDEMDVVVVNEQKEIPTALQTTLKSFMEKGGNVIVIPAMDSNVSQYQNWLSSFGTIKWQNNEPQERLITSISYDHPLYRNVFEKRIDNFQYPKTNQNYVLESVYPAALKYEDGSTFLTGFPVGSGFMYVLAASLQTSNSNFQNAPLIVPTFLEMAQNNTISGVKSQTIGKEASYLLNYPLGKDEIISVYNEELSFIPVLQTMGMKAKLFWMEQPNQSGNYQIKKGQETIDSISFNYPRDESNLNLFSPSLFESLKQVKSIEEAALLLQNSNKETSFWRWLLLGALLFVLIEICIQKYIS
ncbi:MAG: BatA domain-containing protein [Flavobacterium sp.]